MMNLTMLGTGGAFTRLRSNFHNNALLEMGENRYLIDCSLYAFDALAECHDLTPLDVDGLLLTHMHGDHVSGIEELGFRSKFLGDKKPALYCHPHLLARRIEPDDEQIELDLWEHCLRAGMEKIRDPSGEPQDATLDTYFDVYPDRKFELEDGDDEVSFTWFSTDHAPMMASFGLRIECGDEAICYTADSRPRDEAFYQDFDVILHDCALFPRFEGTLHTHLEELLELPEDIQRRIHIMHYGDIDDALAATADTALQVAEPGSSFELG